MKILSIWAPWAQLIAYGCKDVENRSWSTEYRGPMAIHCTKGGWIVEDAEAILDDCVERGLIDETMSATIKVRLEGDRGKVIGIADIVGSESSDDYESPWAVAGGKVLVLDGARLVEPVEVRGGQGLRDLDEDVAAQLGEPGESLARGGYDIDLTELFGRKPRTETNEEAKAAKRKPVAGSAIKVQPREVIERAKIELYRHRPHGELPMDEGFAVRAIDGESNATIWESTTVRGPFADEDDARVFGEQWLEAQRDRHGRISDLRFSRRLQLPERLDEVDDAEAKIMGQVSRLRKLAKECEDDSKTLRKEARTPEVDVTYVDGKFAIVDSPSISEGTAGRRWWGAPEEAGEVQS